MTFKIKHLNILKTTSLFLVLVFLDINAASSKETAMNCVFKEPIYKFIDRLILPYQILEKKNGEWQSFCTGPNEQITVLDGSAKCSKQKPIFFARMINPIEWYAFSTICKNDDLYKFTAHIHRPYIYEHWDTKLNICSYFDFLESAGFKTTEPAWNTFFHDGKQWRSSNPKYFKQKRELKELKEKLLNTTYYAVEKTEFNFNEIMLLDFETKLLKHSKEPFQPQIPENVRLVVPSDGTGKWRIRDIAGNPWQIIDFKQSSTYDCKKVSLD